MNRTEGNPEARLDAALDGIRSEPLEGDAVEQARRRVWARLAQQAAHIEPADSIGSCADFQRLFDAYSSGNLSPARRALVEDHLHECVACRKKYGAFEAPPVPVVVTEMKPRRTWTAPRWAIAAAVAIGVVAPSWYIYDNFGPAPSGPRVTVLSADGSVFRLSGQTLAPVSSGVELSDREILRTGLNGHASVRLLDGSVVEVGDRAEFSVSATRKDTTIHLGRGQVIVQAAKKRTGPLYLATADSRVMVTGTVFSVNRGSKGSRVSVVEGQVRVDHAGGQSLLAAGEQVTTNPAIGRVAIEDEIAWSRNLSEHLAMLKQFAALKEKLATIQMPGLRYNSRLLPSVPAGSSVFLSVPNLGTAFEQAQRMIEEQARQNPGLLSWMGGNEGKDLASVIDRVRRLSQYLGEEIVFAAQSCNKEFCGVLMAEVHRPGLKEFLQAELANVTQGGTGPRLRIVEGTVLPQPQQGEMLVVFHNNRVFVGERPDLILAAINGNTPFAREDFGQAIASSFARGTGILFAANLSTITRDNRPTNARDQATLAQAGIDQVKYLIAEHKDVNGTPQHSAVISFNGARRGFASWLDAPGPIGALNFISPNAQLAAAAVTKRPTEVLQDALALGANGPSGLRELIAELQREGGLNLRDDIAAALGGEFAFAMDGPVLTGGWKVSVEVNDPARLQTAFQRLAEMTNRKLAGENRPERLTINQESVGSQVFYRLAIPQGGPMSEVHWMYSEGYLFAGANRALLHRTLQDKAAGQTLARSQNFSRLLPRDNRTNFSAMIYQNAGDALRLLAQGAGAAGGMTSTDQAAVSDLTRALEPMLVVAYGDTDRIGIASQGSALNLLMQAMMGRFLAPGPQSAGTRKELRAYRN